MACSCCNLMQGKAILSTKSSCWAEIHKNEVPNRSSPSNSHLFVEVGCPSITDLHLQNLPRQTTSHRHVTPPRTATPHPLRLLLILQSLPTSRQTSNLPEPISISSACLPAPDPAKLLLSIASPAQLRLADRHLRAAASCDNRKKQVRNHDWPAIPTSWVGVRHPP